MQKIPWVKKSLPYSLTCRFKPIIWTHPPTNQKNFKTAVKCFKFSITVLLAGLFKSQGAKPKQKQTEFNGHDNLMYEP